MEHIVKSKHLVSFYTGTFLSQLGSYVFIFGMLFFPAQAGWTSFQIGCLLSASHFFVVIGILKWGDLGDRIAPKKLLLLIEVFAMIASVFFIFFWTSNTEISRYLFIFFVGLRSMIVAIQGPSRNKYLKLISTEYHKTKFLSILLTITTQGTGVFSSVLCLLFFNKFTFVTSMVFDACTFFINGLLILTLPELPITPTPKISIYKRFKVYLNVDHFLSIKDILASVMIAGVSMLMIRLSAENKNLAFYLGGMFGLSFWISGIIIHKIKIINLDYYIWPIYSCAYLGLAFAVTDLEKIIWMGVVFLMYAALMHIYITQWQHKSPVASISNIFSIRSIVLTFTLGLGEFVMGKISHIVPLTSELYFRAGAVCIVFLSILIIRKKYEFK